jgi:hypothetical protein
VPLVIISGYAGGLAITSGYGSAPGGAGLFFLDSAELPHDNVVRARFTSIPKSSGGTSSERATTAANWILTGPGSIPAIQVVTTATDDNEVVDIHLASDLTPGDYVLTAAASILSASGDSIAAPLAVAFTLRDVQQEAISGGASNSSSLNETGFLATCKDRLNKFLNPLFRGKTNWDAVIEALAVGDAEIYRQAENSFDQLFLSTAGGSFLTSRASDRGIKKPPRTGLSDDLFRRFATSIVNGKLTQGAFLEALDVLYGIDSTTAFAETSLQEPFVLFDNSTLDIRIDEKFTTSVVFKRREFGILRRATAEEVAASITRAMLLSKSGGYAVAKNGKVRIYSGSRGLGSSVRITSGTAQIYLRFPENRFPGNSTTTWNITTLPGGKAKISPASDAFYDLSSVEPGDYINIIGYQFDPLNRGSFVVEEAVYRYTPSLEQYVVVSNADAVTQSVVQTTYQDVSIFKASKLTTYDRSGYVVVDQLNGTSRISIPATTAAVIRNSSNAAHLNSPVEFEVSALARDFTGLVTITTTGAHGMGPGSQFDLDGFVPTLTLPPVSGAVPSGAFSNDFAEGTGNLSGFSQWSVDTTYQGAEFATAVDLDSDILLIGGNTYSAGVPTPKNTAAFFRVQSKSTDSTGQNQHVYRWFQGTIGAQYNLGTAVATSDIATAYNITRLFGGYPVSPWSGPTSADVMYPTAAVLNKTTIKPTVLSSVQFDNAQGILAALGFWLHTNAVSGDLLSISTGGTTRTYGFGTGGDTTITIGGSASATMANLITAINADGPALWKALALSTTAGGYPGDAIALAEEAVGLSKSPLRIWGNAGAASRITTISYATATQLNPDYTSGTTTALPSADPGSGRAGFNVDITGLATGRTHEILGGGFRRWTGAVWSTTMSWLTTSATGGTMATPVAEAKATWMGNTKFLVTGGTTKLNKATAQVQDCSLVPTWTNIYSLKEARCQHAQVKLNSTSVLVIGGRRPADDAQRTTLGFTSWDMDDAFGATNFVGPVDVAISGNSRIAGKIGYGVDLTTATMTSTGGAPQTTLNTALLADYTVMGWMTPGAGGCVFRNGIAGAWATSADNTLIAFGIDPADDKFWIRYMYGSGTVVTKKSALTVAALMSASDFVAPYPRYHHFCITKNTEGGAVRLRLYINGVQSDTWTDVLPSGGSSGLWSFSQADGAYSRFTGCVDAVGISATVLTADQVKSVYLDEIGVLYDNPNSPTASPVGRVLNTCEIAPITTGPSIRVGSMAHARFASGVVQLNDGRILVCGGIGYNPSTDGITTKSQRELELKSVEIYDPVLQIWNTIQDMKEPHSYPSVGYFPELNRVYISGGFTSTATEYLDLRTMTWETSTAIPVVRAKSGGAAVKGAMLHASGVNLVSGGLYASIASDTSMVPGDEEIFCGGLNQTHTAVAGTTGTTIKFQTPKHPNWTQGTSGVVTSLTAAPGEILGPIITDTKTSGKTSTAGVLSETLESGAKYSSVKLGANEALQFPESGYLVFNWGYSNEVGPVKYLGRISTDTLAIDASFRFPSTLKPGASVRLVTKTPVASKAAAFWLTASNAGLAAAKKTLLDISATGIELDIEVRYPGDRGLGGAGRPTEDNYKISDIVEVFGSDDLDTELEAARE